MAHNVPKNRLCLFLLRVGATGVSQPLVDCVLMLKCERHVATSEEIKFELPHGAELLHRFCRFAGFHRAFRTTLMQRLLIEKGRDLIVGSMLAHGPVREACGRIQVMFLPLLGEPDDDAARLHGDPLRRYAAWDCLEISISSRDTSIWCSSWIGILFTLHLDSYLVANIKYLVDNCQGPIGKFGPGGRNWHGSPRRRK